MLKFFRIVCKDIKLELRGKQMIILLFSLSMLLALIVSLALSSSFLPLPQIKKIFPALFWIIFLMVSTLCFSKATSSELDTMAVRGLILSGISADILFISKTLVVAIIIACSQLVAAVFLNGLLGLDFNLFTVSFLFLIFFVSLGYSALGLLLSTISYNTTLKNTFLPLILLPLLFPLIFAGVELSFDILISGQTWGDSKWWWIITAFNAIYISFGGILYRALIWSNSK